MVDGGEAVSERKRAFGGGQNSTLKKAVSEQRERLVGGKIQPFKKAVSEQCRGKTASMLCY